MKKSLSDDSLSISKNRLEFFTTNRTSTSCIASASNNTNDDQSRNNNNNRVVKHVKFEEFDIDIDVDDVSPRSSPFSPHSSTACSSTTSSSTPRTSLSNRVCQNLFSARHNRSPQHHHHHSHGSAAASNFIRRAMSTFEFHKNVVDTSSTFAERFEHDHEQFVTNKFEVGDILFFCQFIRIKLMFLI